MSDWTLRASHQWAVRPDDERFVSMQELFNHCQDMRDRSQGKVVSTRAIEVQPATKSGNPVSDSTPADDFDYKGLTVVGGAEVPYAPTNWAFGQLAQRAGAPSAYLASLPSPIAADCLNYSLRQRPVEEIGLLLQSGDNTLRAATGPRYGRIWNADIAAAVIKLQQRQPNWQVPGEFGKRVQVTKQNTTLYASDRDMFIFLTDEENRIEVPNKRPLLANTPTSLARGFYCWNSEVGDKTFGIGTFFLNFVCMNRTIWGGEGYNEVKIRHTAGAPDRFVEEIMPALLTYARSSALPIQEAVKAAQAARLDDVDEFLAKRFGARKVQAIKTVHELEEQRPIETLWDAAQGVTALARGITHQDTRVEMEREAGAILKLAA